MDIYIDVLMLENIVVNYFILLLTSKICKYQVSSLKLLLGSISGAMYLLLLIFYPDIEFYYTIFGKILLSFGIIAIGFWPEKIKVYFKLLVVFYFCTFIFAGTTLAFISMSFSDGLIQNGIYYIPINPRWRITFLSIALSVILVKIVWELIQTRHNKEQIMTTIKITIEEQNINLFALIDTGNFLHDPVTKVPVVIVEFSAIKNILPEEMRMVFENSKEQELNHILEYVSDTNWLKRVRIIPFSSIGKENGILIGLRPDYIEVGENNEKRRGKDVIIGICNKALSKEQEYRAILSPELV